ncbi:MAG: hypothetical protein K8S25_10925 [Alphaproteobacteria bacterium]|nr:hypothetical protein [Alphaproteobacteria bacterium]
MQHKFRFVASRFSASTRPGQIANDRGSGGDVIAWLRERLIENTVEADIGLPAQDGLDWGLWLELGDDRFLIYARSADGEAGNTLDSQWHVGVEAFEPHLALRPQARTRRQTRMDGLVAVLRTIMTSEPGLVLLSEEDD